MNVLIVILTQLLFTAGDLIASHHVQVGGFTIANLVRPWFILYFTLLLLATFGQLFVLAQAPLGWMSSVFGAVSIILANLLGLLVLKQVLSPASYAGVLLASLAFLVMALFGSPSIASSTSSGP
jgi:hypothetical protein